MKRPHLPTTCFFVFIFALVPLQNVLAAGNITALAPRSMTHQIGSAQGNLNALKVRDQSWYDDNHAKYVVFYPEARYAGCRTYRLPASMSPASVTALRIEANYCGPETLEQVWTWLLYD